MVKKAQEKRRKGTKPWIKRKKSTRNPISRLHLMQTVGPSELRASLRERVVKKQNREHRRGEDPQREDVFLALKGTKGHASRGMGTSGRKKEGAMPQ